MGNSGNPIDTDLIASNIKTGVNIFGIVGTFGGTGSSGLINGTMNRSDFGPIRMINSNQPDVANCFFTSVPGGAGDGKMLLESGILWIGMNVEYLSIGSGRVLLVFLGKIDTVTGIKTYITTTTRNAGSANVYVESIYKDGDIITFNMNDDGNSGFPYSYRYDLVANTWTFDPLFRHTTGSNFGLNSYNLSGVTIGIDTKGNAVGPVSTLFAFCPRLTFSA